ncbi:MAG: PH domain-containing protein [Nitrococcus mobilis]|nr:PH domain-containing protein [Nitrococcus mobilis]
MLNTGLKQSDLPNNKKVAAAMAYIGNNLMDGERLIHRGHQHPIVFAVSTIVCVFGLYFIVSGGGSKLSDFGISVLIIGGLLVLRAVLSYSSNELAVNNQRVIAKFGFIGRHTVELNHSKVESLNISQGMLGRLLNYGTLVVRGTGSVSTPIPRIRAPLEFRRAQNGAVEASGQSAVGASASPQQPV